ncbi:PREDICTED: organic cation/carnitine transporter 4-like [Papilio polytes]|uniref:organic cation/carnitine transporter 4-like n=1 Tax=Papilio polytes TaxID=76194 RepID=UPI000675F197|nr:PREDICTED: organic cation/carnitine transporter 4-like [Papilio polytes]
MSQVTNNNESRIDLEDILDKCKVQAINNSDTNDCREWIYDNPHTFVAEFQLANQEWKRTLVGTTHCFGYMVGLLIVGPLSDRLGRKNAIVVTAVLGGVLGVARSFSPWYWLYIALEFLEAAIGDPGSPAYILSKLHCLSNNSSYFTH